ncbi:MAG: gluconeogenesis factor YvcK family protein [Candidatus Limnocylindria bacterium]
MSELRVVCVGGGLGAPTVMAGLREHTEDITALIAVTDSGRSTGKVRIALDVPAPGDIRNALVVLAEGDAGLRRLFQHRFATERSAELDGMAFGNLFLAALTQQEGSFLRAVREAARLLGVRGKVLPVTLYNTHLRARLIDGAVVDEEVNVRATGKPAIDRIFLADDGVVAADGAVEAIAAADLITIGPGSLYTTVCACLLVPDLARAIATSRALVVYVANTTTQPGQTDGLTLARHVAAVLHYLGGSGLDVALLNDDPPPAELREHYAARGLRYLEPTADELERIAALGVRAATAPIIDRWSEPREIWRKQDTIRHDSRRVAAALLALVAEPDGARA